MFATNCYKAEIVLHVKIFIRRLCYYFRRSAIKEIIYKFEGKKKKRKDKAASNAICIKQFLQYYTIKKL